MMCNKYRQDLDLGDLINQHDHFSVYKHGEVFYRGMNNYQFSTLCETCELIGLSETFISPTLEYIKTVGYGSNGSIVAFLLRHGTLIELMKIGVKNDRDQLLVNMPFVHTVRHWEKHYALFKKEGRGHHVHHKRQINIGLGKGDALGLFNQNIISFKKID